MPLGLHGAKVAADEEVAPARRDLFAVALDLLEAILRFAQGRGHFPIHEELEGVL